MALELLLSTLVTLLCLSLAWSVRRSFVSVHLLPLGALCTGLPLVRLFFGGSPWRASEETIVFAYGSVAVYALCIWIGAKTLQDRSLARFAHWLRSVNTKDLPILAATWAISILWSARIYQAVEYGVLVSGSATEEAIRSMPYWLTSFNSIAALIGLGAIVVLAIAASRGKAALWAIVIIELLWAFISGGRREFLFLALLFLWIARQAGLLRMRTLVAGGIVAMSLLYVLTPVFLYARDFNQDLLAAGVSPIPALLSALAQSWNECGLGLGCLDRAGANVIDRGNAMEFMKLIVGAERRGSDFLLGFGFLYSLVWAVPSFLVTKPELMTEQYLQVNFALQLGDDAISIPALSYADFGILGCAIAGVVLSLYAFFAARYAQRRYQVLIFASITMGVLATLWNVERDPIAYVVLVRDSLILVTVAAAATFVSRLIRSGKIR